MTVETGLSDFHKITLTVMKAFYKNQKPNIVTYQSYNETFLMKRLSLTSRQYYSNDFREQRS